MLICRDGSERTGAFITLDLVLEHLRKTGKIDVLRTILVLRQFRTGIVTQDVLLNTVYSAIATYLRCGTTVISTKQLNKYVQNLKKKRSINSLSQLEREFQVNTAV